MDDLKESEPFHLLKRLESHCQCGLALAAVGLVDYMLDARPHG